MNSTEAIADWLIDGARSAATTQAVFAEFCDRLLGCGFPISRAGLFVHTLHPLIAGERLLWKPGQPIDINPGTFEMFQTEDFRRSPVRYAIDNRISIRRKLAEENVYSTSHSHVN